jgi:hypothetical protein
VRNDGLEHFQVGRNRTCSLAFPGCGAVPLARLRASSTRYGGAPLIRDLPKRGACKGPGAARHRYVMRMRWKILVEHPGRMKYYNTGMMLITASDRLLLCKQSRHL